jgi:hypothetical protein
MDNYISEKPAKFFFAGMKAPSDEGGGSILLGDNTGGGTVMVRSNRFRGCWSLDFSWTALFIHTHFTMLVHSKACRWIFRNLSIVQARQCLYIYIYWVIKKSLRS